MFFDLFLLCSQVVFSGLCFYVAKFSVMSKFICCQVCCQVIFTCLCYNKVKQFFFVILLSCYQVFLYCLIFHVVKQFCLSLSSSCCFVLSQLSCCRGILSCLCYYVVRSHWSHWSCLRFYVFNNCPCLSVIMYSNSFVISLLSSCQRVSSC